MEEFNKESELGTNYPDLNADRPNFDNKYYFYKEGGEYKKLDVDNILYLEAKDNYVTINYVKGKPITIRTTLEGLSRQLPVYEIFRINRTHAVCVKYMTSWTKEYVKLGELQFPISKMYYPDLEYRFEIMGG